MQRALVTTTLLILAAGPSCAEPKPAWGPDLLSSGSFESGSGERLPSGWSVWEGARNADRGPDSAVAIDDRRAHSGRRALRLSGNAATASWSALSAPPVPVREGERYLLSGWIATRQVRREGNQYQNCNLVISFADAAGKRIPVGGYPVAASPQVLGTSDWQRVETVVQAPPGSREARVGCFLSCSGTAWFDDVSLEARAGTDWQRRDSARFVFRWESGRGPTERDVAGNEAHLEALERLLGLPHPEPIPYFKHASPERKQALTGSLGNAHSEGDEIHSIFWSDRHEVVHVLTRPIEPTVALFGEGLAVHLSGAWQGRPVHDAARQVVRDGRQVPLSELADTAAFRRHPDAVTYALAGSFVGWLIERSGMPRFKDAYSCGAQAEGARRRLRELYGRELEVLEREWLQSLSP